MSLHSSLGEVPNVYFRHPLVAFLENEVTADESISDIPFSRFSGAAFRDGVITWQRRCAQRRLALDRSKARLSESGLPGQAHAVRYLEHQYRRNRSAGTIYNNQGALYSFFKFMQKNGLDHLEQLTRREIEAFVEQEQDRDMKNETIRHSLQILYAFLRFLKPDKIIHAELLERKIRIRMPQRLPKAIPTEDIRRLLSVIDHVRDHAMVLMLLRTGMRIGELLSLRVHDVDLSERTVKIYQAEKNSVGRVVYLSDDARRALALWMQQRKSEKSCIFYGLKGEMTYGGARRRFVKHLLRAGLTDKGYTLHCLRHTFATDLLNAGMRLECLQQLLGHSNLEITRIYARLTDATREEEYFKAMAKIERGETDDYDRHDCQL